jgi:antitoxin (DNA-binding transcriptional repressor) of toxin-antitoxin stability system
MKKNTYTVHEAKTNLSRLIEEACSGKEVIIARGRDKKPVAKIVSLAAAQKQRRPGAFEGKIWADPDAFKPLTAEEAKEWGIE